MASDSMQRNGSAQRPRRGLPSANVLKVCAATFSAVLLALAAGYWTKSHAEAQHPAVQSAPSDVPLVTFIVAQRGKPETELLLPASLAGMQETTIYARTNGYLKRWLVDMGDEVKEGQLIAEIDTPETDQELQQARAELNQVKANLKLAKATAERYRSLAAQAAVSAQEVDEKTGAYEARKADYEVTQARIRRLENLKAFSRVMAPFPGVIAARNVEVGSLVAAGSSSANGWLFKLVQANPLRAMVSVPQGYVQMVKAGQDVDVLIRERPGKVFSGKVSRLAGAFDVATRTMLVEVRVPNGGNLLVPGMYGQARFKLMNAEPPVIVPGNALVIGGEGPRAFVVDKSDTARLRPIRIGRDYGKEVEIIEGIAEGERVVMNPRDTLADGTKVTAVAQQ